MTFPRVGSRAPAPDRNAAADIAAAQAHWETWRAAECNRFRREFAGITLPAGYRARITGNGLVVRRSPTSVGLYFRRRADFDSWARRTN
jgi:hypothetical protein